MRLESLDGLGACATENKTLTYLLPASKLKAMGVVSTTKELDSAGIPYTTSIVNGEPVVTVGSQTVPGLLPVETKDQVVNALKSSLASDANAPALVADEATTLTTQKKVMGFAALALLALAALAQQLKSKPGAMSGISTPKKKLAFARL